MTGVEIAQVAMTALRFASRPVKWLKGVHLLIQKARIDIEDRPHQLMERRLRRLGKELEREKDPKRRQGLEIEVKEARDELIGYDIEISERSLRQAKLPSLDELAEIGKQRITARSMTAKKNNLIKNEKEIGE